ncbi:MAG: CRP/FNR family cyclic AMP-dependent transcriptional regulator [Halieaceae bacterium]|jgi:CRP/FNR family cyclic AMP-dependent transcriptional regulator
MRTIPHLHDFISELPELVQAEIARLSTTRQVTAGEAVYRAGDPSTEIFRLIEGAVKLCNYTLDGAEIITGEFRPGDCFGDTGVIDGLPRVSNAIAVKNSQLSVVSQQNFEILGEKYGEIYLQLSRMLCRRVRFLYSLNEDSVGLKLHVRLARTLLRLAYSHGHRNEQDEIHIEFSHEELSNMLGTSRQSVSKELKSLEREGSIELRYGRIYIHELAKLSKKYELDIGMEQVTPVYNEAP